MENGEGKKENCEKREGGKCKKEGERSMKKSWGPFFFFSFFFFLLFTFEICFGVPKWKIFIGNISRREKSEKVTLPPLKNIPLVNSSANLWSFLCCLANFGQKKKLIEAIVCFCLILTYFGENTASSQEKSGWICYFRHTQAICQIKQIDLYKNVPNSYLNALYPKSWQMTRCM